MHTLRQTKCSRITPPQTLYGTILLADQYCLLKYRKLVVPSDCPWSPVIYEGGHGLGFRYKLMVSMQG